MEEYRPTFVMILNLKKVEFILNYKTVLIELLYAYVNVAKKRTALGDALKLTSNNFPQDLITKKQPRK